MAERVAARIGRRAARAILIDENRRLLVIKRSRPGQAPYWTTPGGGVEDTDVSIEAALRRELAEELGARIANVSQVFLVSTPSDIGVAVQHFFVARLARLDESARSGPEFTEAARGRYDLERVEMLGDDMSTLDLRPVELREFIRTNRDALLVEAGLAD